MKRLRGCCFKNQLKILLFVLDLKHAGSGREAKYSCLNFLQWIRRFVDVKSTFSFVHVLQSNVTRNRASDGGGARALRIRPESVWARRDLNSQYCILRTSVFHTNQA